MLLKLHYADVKQQVLSSGLRKDTKTVTKGSLVYINPEYIVKIHPCETGCSISFSDPDDFIGIWESVDDVLLQMKHLYHGADHESGVGM